MPEETLFIYSSCTRPPLVLQEWLPVQDHKIDVIKQGVLGDKGAATCSTKLVIKEGHKSTTKRRVASCFHFFTPPSMAIYCTTMVMHDSDYTRPPTPCHWPYDYGHA